MKNAYARFLDDDPYGEAKGETNLSQETWKKIWKEEEDMEKALQGLADAACDELAALHLWSNVKSLDADIAEGIQISISKLTSALKAAKPFLRKPNEAPKS